MVMVPNSKVTHSGTIVYRGVTLALFDVSCMCVPVCPCCHAKLEFIYDRCVRFVRLPSASNDKVRRRFAICIERRKCPNPNCGMIHRILPNDFVLPFKQYSVNVIQTILDSVDSVAADQPDLNVSATVTKATEKASESLTTDDRIEDMDYPCPDTISNWMEWRDVNKGEANHVIVCVGIKILTMEMGEEGKYFLFNSMRVIPRIKKEFKNNWLGIVVLIMVNTGHVPRRVY